jgi:hypothetical protein
MRVLMMIQTPLMRTRVSVPDPVAVTLFTPTVAPRSLDAFTL